MNFFLALRTTPELRDAISRARSMLQQRADADLAVAANARNIEGANTAIPELESTAGRLQAEAIKCEALASANGASRSDVSKAVKAADKAAVDFAEKKRELERATAARNVLSEMAREADAAIVLAKAALTASLAAYRGPLLDSLDDDLRAACDGRASLRGVLAAARLVDAEFPGGLCKPLLDNLKIISARTYRISHDEIGRARVTGTDLLAEETASATLPEEAALALREINAIVDALKLHKPFTIPALRQPQAQTPQRSPSEQRRYLEQAERIRQSEEEFDQREHRAKQPQTEEQRRKWALDVRYPGTQAPGASQNRARGAATPAELGARSLDGDGSVLDEYGWMDGAQPGGSQRGAP